MHRVAISSILAVALLWAGCGSDQTFDAPGFVDAANSHGADLTLGDELTSTDPDTDVFGVNAGGKPDPTGATGAEGAIPTGASGAEGFTSGASAHAEDRAGGGSLIVASDADAAGVEYGRCEATLSLLCYRAANVVLAFEDLTADQRANMNAAISALAE